MQDSIAKLRRFHRAVTRQAGLLDDSFLGRGRPLGAARVLNAIGAGKTDLAALRAYLGLDSGLMSRLLRSLEQEALIQTLTDPNDSRRRQITLTPQGQAEYSAYEALSDRQAIDILSKPKNSEALLAAMELITHILNRDQMRFILIDPRDPKAQIALQSYYRELGERLNQGFDVSLSADPEACAMIAPRGAFFIIENDGAILGCGGLKGTDKGYAEIKRVWITPSARGFGLAKEMMEQLEAKARELGIQKLRLDSNSALHEAITLYRKSGWTEIDRFNDDPYPDHFFEKPL